MTIGQLAPNYYLTQGGVLFTDGTQDDLTAMVRRCGLQPARVIRPAILRGAQVVSGGTARLLTDKACAWARRAGVTEIGEHPDDATLGELLAVSRAFRGRP